MTQPIPVELQDNPVKLYSEKAIGFSTFLAGPLAAGIMMRRNFLNTGNTASAGKTLFVTIAVTLLFMALILVIPEHIIDKIPGFVFPAIYTPLIYLAVRRYQGKMLEEHTKINGLYYSGWRVTGVALASAAGFIGLIFAAAYFAPAGFNTEKYDQLLLEFQKNEEKALSIFDLPDTVSPERIQYLILNEGIPLWHRNIELLNEMDDIDGLITDLKVQNSILREYSELRISSYELIHKAITEDTKAYDQEIDLIIKKIDEVLARL